MSPAKNLRRAEFAPATAQDAEELGRLMRDGDRRECALARGLGPAETARLSLELSDAAFSARIGGNLLCLFGASRDSLADASAVAWMLCTDEPERHPREFLANCAEGFRLLAAALPDVEVWTNAVLADNARAVRWLGWAGAWFSAGAPRTGLAGGRFRPFAIKPAPFLKGHPLHV